MDATCIHCDNHSCVKLSENPVFHDKSKHIEIKYHYIRDMVHIGLVKHYYVVMDEQMVDVFEYFKEKMAYFISRFPPRGGDESGRRRFLRAFLTWW